MTRWIWVQLLVINQFMGAGWWDIIGEIKLQPPNYKTSKSLIFLPHPKLLKQKGRKKGWAWESSCQWLYVHFDSEESARGNYLPTSGSSGPRRRIASGPTWDMLDISALLTARMPSIHSTNSFSPVGSTSALPGRMCVSVCSWREGRLSIFNHISRQKQKFMRVKRDLFCSSGRWFGSGDSWMQMMEGMYCVSGWTRLAPFLSVANWSWVAWILKQVDSESDSIWTCSSSHSQNKLLIWAFMSEPLELVILTTVARFGHLENYHEMAAAGSEWQQCPSFSGIV